MIYIGDFNILRAVPPELLPSMIIYNLGSPYEVGIRLFNLIPPLDLDDPNFDTNYANYLMSEPMAFMEMMSIVINTYNQENVFISIMPNNIYLEEVIQSLIKFINFRYSIIISEVNTIEDLFESEEYPLSREGLFNIDNDRERYLDMLPYDVIQDMARDAYRIEMRRRS